ncbi:alpha/beta fold hydrolase [Methylobacterium aquaticum]|uniref:alpha/beta fold hydrolase n=1 Tax=Methylobacterium aquaticum TaxID=270351 RepID=UPI003D18006A
MSHPVPERRFVPTRAGLLHVATCGSGLPVLLLHQTPRSWDEYRDVLPLLGAHVRTIAMDTPGFGDSPALAGEAPSIEAWAEAVIALMDALDLPGCCLAGHHTGAVVALEAAVRAPDRVTALVLSSCPMVDAPRRAHHAAKVPIDTVTPDAEGGHLIQLWRGRQPFYPREAPELLDRFIVDALRAGPMAAEGHRVVNRYRMEDRIGLVRAPTLVIGATEDPHAFPATPRVAAAIRGSTVTEIVGGTVPLPDAMPIEFSHAILRFLRMQDLLPKPR